MLLKKLLLPNVARIYEDVKNLTDEAVDSVYRHASENDSPSNLVLEAQKLVSEIGRESVDKRSCVFVTLLLDSIPDLLLVRGDYQGIDENEVLYKLREEAK